MLKEKIQQDIKEALKAGESEKRLTLSMLASAIKNRELEKRTKLSKTEKDTSKLEKGSELTDEEIIEVIASEIKKRKEAAESYEKGNRPELAQKEKAEAEIFMKYMPEQMPEDEVRRVVKEVIQETGASGAKDMGKVIGAAMAKVKGRTEGQVVSKIVKEELGS